MADAPILIVGAGPVGLCTAIALHQAGLHGRLIDVRPEAQFDDPRAIALSHGSRLILERLGVWREIGATPIRQVHVSQQHGFGQTRIDAADYRLPALGHVARLGALTQALCAAVRSAGIDLAYGQRLTSTAHAGQHVVADIAAGVVTCQVETPLLLLAEGKPLQPALQKAYGQTAIVTEAFGASPPDGRAFERFTPEGPLALLPLDTGYSVVWCMHDARAKEVLAWDDATLLETFRKLTGFAGVAWRHMGARTAYPLTLVRAAEASHSREIALGNAAQTLHPVAGQGLNLGLRDGFELAEAIKHGLSDARLKVYLDRRRRDRQATIRLTDQYVSLFSNQFAPLRLARGAGLTLFDLVPPLRRTIARRMMFGLR